MGLDQSKSAIGTGPRQMNQKPQLSFWQIWNMCFGFLGIQFGFALQNANVSRIFQTLGASMDDIPILWIAAPLTGLIVRSEEHTSELQSLMRISYAVFCLKKKKQN